MRPARRYRELPRPEPVLLLLALLATLAAKLLVARRYHGGDVLAAWSRVTLADIAFLAGVATLTAALYAIRPAKVLQRLGVLLGLLVAAWAALNAVWAMATGVQLHPGVLLVVLRHPAEFGPTVQPQLRAHPVGAIAGVIAVVAVAAYAFMHLVRPPELCYTRRKLLTASVWGALVVTNFTLSHHLLPLPVVPSLGQVLGYSSHWNALRALVAGSDHSNGSGVQTRHLPRVGERDVTTPPPGRFPPIVIVLLESVSYAAAALDDAAQTPMPTLRRLGLEGADLIHTRVPVSQTGKAFWAVLIGTTPDVSDDYAEATLADQPYEGLPSLLRRVGYRSAFFQMAKGAFECAPGAMHNFGFDWAWFRENLEDPSADLGYLAGDDFRMLDPALAWATQDDRPFLLMMITSVAHDPYDVPATFGPRLADREAAYLQAVRYTDAFLAELCRRLDGLALLDETLLCVLGDHGESLRPDAQRTRWVPYEEVVRVPWVIRWPGHVPVGLPRRIGCWRGTSHRLNIAA
ncbi:MAG: sulfatase-like hydrolase/transferase [Planctomycetota bacterium]